MRRRPVLLERITLSFDHFDRVALARLGRPISREFEPLQNLLFEESSAFLQVPRAFSSLSAIGLVSWARPKATKKMEGRPERAPSHVPRLVPPPFEQSPPQP